MRQLARIAQHRVITVIHPLHPVSTAVMINTSKVALGSISNPAMEPSIKPTRRLLRTIARLRPDNSHHTAVTGVRTNMEHRLCIRVLMVGDQAMAN